MSRFTPDQFQKLREKYPDDLLSISTDGLAMSVTQGRHRIRFHIGNKGWFELTAKSIPMRLAGGALPDGTFVWMIDGNNIVVWDEIVYFERWLEQVEIAP